MRLLITGGYGFLGSNLAYAALSRGVELAIFDDLSRLGSSENKKWLEAIRTHKFYKGDVSHRDDVFRAVREFNPQTIFHLAGQVAMTIASGSMLGCFC